MRKVKINFYTDVKYAHAIRVVIDNENKGNIAPNSYGAFRIDNNEHSLCCVYDVEVLGGVGRYASLQSEIISFPAEINEFAPEEVSYEYNVTVVAKSFKEMYKANVMSFGAQLFTGKRAAEQQSVQDSYSIVVEQDSNNAREVKEKQRKNYLYYKGDQVVTPMIESMQNDPFRPLDFKAFDCLDREVKNSEYMRDIFVPALIHKAYSILSRYYLEEKISIRIMFKILEQMKHLPFSETILSNSFKHYDYLYELRNDINSIFSDDVICEMEELSNSDFQIVDCIPWNYDEMVNYWNGIDKLDFAKKEQSKAKKLFDRLVHVDMDVSYFDNLKKSLVFIALAEREKPEIGEAYSKYQEVLEQTFCPIVYDGEKTVLCKTVDMLIADAIHFSKVNAIDNINKSLSNFLHILCPKYGVSDEQYGILQAVFAWLKAYKQETMVLEAMVANNVPRNNEQDQRLAFLNSQNGFVASKMVNATENTFIHQTDIDESKLFYDYKFLTMDDANVVNHINELSMENQSLYNSIVVGEWTKNVELSGIEWKQNDVKVCINDVLKKNFGERFYVENVESGVVADGWAETTPAIVIKDNMSNGYPWLAFLVVGEQLMLNQITLSVYTLYMPEKDILSDNIYNRNNGILNKIQLIKKKQNPKINSLLQIVTNLIIHEMENWVNSQQISDIYDL